jgi:hypothetical protein
MAAVRGWHLEWVREGRCERLWLAASETREVGVDERRAAHRVGQAFVERVARVDRRFAGRASFGVRLLRQAQAQREGDQRVRHPRLGVEHAQPRAGLLRTERPPVDGDGIGQPIRASAELSEPSNRRERGAHGRLVGTRRERAGLAQHEVLHDVACGVGIAAAEPRLDTFGGAHDRVVTEERAREAEVGLTDRRADPGQ